jgi:hypothetical protein
MPEQGVGCVWKNFRPNETAVSGGFDTYVDTGSGIAVRSNLTRPEIFPDTSHTLLLHRDTTIAVADKGDPPPF